MARFISAGRSTSLTSTAITLMPHGSVWRSMISCRAWLILSRSAEQVVELGGTDDAAQRRLRQLRRGVQEVLHLQDRLVRLEDAEVDHAFTFTETLSRVMTSCGGTSSTSVRRLTFTMRSTIG